jgi:hypothetical protein
MRQIVAVCGRTAFAEAATRRLFRRDHVRDHVITGSSACGQRAGWIS